MASIEEDSVTNRSVGDNVGAAVDDDGAAVSNPTSRGTSAVEGAGVQSITHSDDRFVLDIADGLGSASRGGLFASRLVVAWIGVTGCTFDWDRECHCDRSSDCRH